MIIAASGTMNVKVLLGVRECLSDESNSLKDLLSFGCNVAVKRYPLAMVQSDDVTNASVPIPLPISGWREWTCLPQLSIRSIKAKIDSGARSSCLHAFDMEFLDREGVAWVRFAVHPIQRNDEKVVWCEAPVHDRRLVRSSNGEVSVRNVIRTELRIFGRTWPIDLTLNNRDAMGFRMLIGREAVRGRFLIDSNRSYLAGRPKRFRKKRKS